jgi:hypothetical protein
MCTILAVCLGVLFMSSTTNAQQSPAQLAQPWEQLYQGEDVTGEHVIAMWSFDGEVQETDAGGKGYDLELIGAQISPDGKFGGCLESFPGWPVEDKKHQARVQHKPELCPAGAFTLEMWIKPKPELNQEYGDAFLLDKKYVEHANYQFILRRPASDGRRSLQAVLGYGDDSATYTSEPAEYETGVWYHVAFTYDAAGKGSFFRDGVALGGTSHPGRGPVIPSQHDLFIGDRAGSYYHGFPGFIDQVRISRGALEFRPATFAFTSDRTSFVRMEDTPALEFIVTNMQRTPLSGAVCRFAIADADQMRVELPEIAPGQAHTVQYAFDTALRPGTYRIHARMEINGESPYTSEEQYEVVLVNRPLPLRMPVVLWGGGDMAQVKDLGFTHMMGVSANMSSIWDAGEAIPPQSEAALVSMKERLNEALTCDLKYISSLSPGSWARQNLPDYQRVDREGNLLADVNGLYPEIQQFCHNVGQSMSQAYGHFPAFDGAMIHTEVRGASRLSFSDLDRQSFREFAGYDIPEQAQGQRGIAWENILDFPQDRVIPDDYPLHVYYRWFWKQGDGWNDLHTALHEGLKSAAHPGFWTFYDPACRAPKAWGSGGDVDFLSHWTYSYPDPICISTCTDELFAMAEGGPDYQKVMKMTQIIWYRSQTAPMPGEEAHVRDAFFDDQDRRPVTADDAEVEGYRAKWEKEIPDARFITIAPMHLREAFWAKMARPIQGIMYHGWGSLVEGITHGSYRHTNPDTRDELRRLVQTVVEPLGPTLMQVPDRPARVAFLESFASEMFALKGTYGWNGGWTGDAYLIMHYAQLQPQIVYDETIERDGLDQYQVFVMVDCDVLTATVAEQVKAFQARGGIIIGDEKLAPAIKPDILLQSHDRPREADQARALLLQKAAQLRTELDPHFSRYGQSDNPDVITRFRQWGSTDYLFTINDLREFGDYVGHHGLVMENGLPSDATVTVNRPAGYVYDLVAGRQVQAQTERDRMMIPVALGPCEGRVLMITERPIAQVNITGADTVARGGKLTLAVTVADEAGQAVDAVVPVHVEIQDAASQVAEFSGYYGAADGNMQIELDIAPNDVPGVWSVRATELASGRDAVSYFRVSR